MSLATPCPSQARLSSLPRLSLAAFGGFPDDTADIDYTRAIQDEIRNAKPKRRQTINRRIDRHTPVAIFEDIAECEESGLSTQPKRLEGKTLLGKKAQRMPGPAVKKPVEESRPRPLRDVGQARRRPSIMPDDTCSLQPPERMPDNGRDKRRRTIFVPNDATTLMTIHPGARLDSHLDDTFHLSAPSVKMQPAEASEDIVEELPRFQKPVRRPRNSLTAAPRRIPLQQMTANWDETTFDVAGANTGKENLPPHAQYEKAKFSEETTKAAPRYSMTASKTLAPCATSQRRLSVAAQHPIPSGLHIVPRKRVSIADSSLGTAKSAVRAGMNASIMKPISALPENVRGEARDTPVISDSRLRQATRQRVSPKPLVIDREQQRQKLRQMVAAQRVELQTSKLSRYPILPENLSHPELYEDEWLSHQEVALTETINALFASSATRPSRFRCTSSTTRERMITLYHQADVTMLHKRLQASLLYGALSHPQGFAPCDLSRDLGMRKKFLALWLETYDEAALKTAAEVVVGRQIPCSPEKSPDDLKLAETVLDPHASRRAITAFLETFLITVSDIDHAGRDEGSASLDMLRWRKTMQRSLMLIWLLDHAKSDEVIDGCLFRTSSSRKSSVSVLHATSTLLLPSVGDIGRALRHLEYEVTHTQDPLDEVCYHVENIAVDLRDGILLAHLVEIVLYTPDLARRNDENDDNDATVAFTMPDATIVQSALFCPDNRVAAPRILSRHLKLPCIGRAQKLHNVQIALSALQAHGVEGNNATADIQASNIVDGHREKTLSLLWSLLGSFGRSQLVDWQALTADLHRQTGVAPAMHTMPARERQERLLQCWAEAYCAPRQVRVENLTSSFADGRAYAAIVGAFAGRGADHARHRSDHDGSSAEALREGLHALGCSAAFTAQLTSSLGIIPDRKTTLCSLAFLASRLLPLARAHRAAVTLQRAFRKRQERTLARRRAALLDLAQACATVVQTRNRIVAAAETLQRAWRGVLARRINRLHVDVGLLQALAKGWAVRRDISQAQSRSGDSGFVARRTAGRW